MSEAPREEVQSSSIAYVHRRVARWLALGAVLCYAVPIGMLLHEHFAPGVPPPPPGAWAELFGQVSIGAGALALVALVLRAFPRVTQGVVSRAGERVVVETAGLFSRRRLRILAVRTGYLVPDGKRTRAELGLASGDLLQVTAPDFATAVEVLRVAGVDASQQHARFRVDDAFSRAFASMIGACVIGLLTLPIGLGLIRLLSGLVGGLAWMGVVSLLTWLSRDFTSLPEITVGTDGISYKRGPFRRFVPLADVKEVRSSDVTLYIHLRDGRIKALRSLTGADPGRAYSLELRVREALAARRGEHVPAQLELLDRKGRNVSDWSAALSTLARAGSSYRAVGLSADDLAAIVVSPDVTPERRIGAALALSGAGDPAAPERIRIAAAQCASGRVRIALEQVSAGRIDHAAIDEALAETEAEARPARARTR